MPATTPRNNKIKPTDNTETVDEAETEVKREAKELNVASTEVATTKVGKPNNKGVN